MEDRDARRFDELSSLLAFLQPAFHDGLGLGTAYTKFLGLERSI